MKKSYAYFLDEQQRDLLLDACNAIGISPPTYCGDLLISLLEIQRKTMEAEATKTIPTH